MARPIQAWLERADELGGAGRYFDAHEELEEAWREACGVEKTALHGLIQIAAGLHRLKHEPQKTAGAFYLLDRGMEKLERAQSLLVPETLASLEAALRAIRASGKAPATLAFGLKRS